MLPVRTGFSAEAAHDEARVAGGSFPFTSPSAGSARRADDRRLPLERNRSPSFPDDGTCDVGRVGSTVETPLAPSGASAH